MKTPHQFGRTPSKVGAAGLRAGLPGTALAVLQVLHDHTNSDWIAFPGIGTIAAQAGIKGKSPQNRERSVRRALARLKEHGLIVVRRPGGGHGITTEYRIVNDPDEVLRLRAAAGKRLNAKKSDHRSEESLAHTMREESGPGSPQTRTDLAQYPDNQGRETRTEFSENPDTGVRATEGNREVTDHNREARPDGDGFDDQGESRSRPVGAALTARVDRVAANRAALQAHGVDAGQKLEEAATTPELTPEIVEILAIQSKGAKNPPGLLLKLIGTKTAAEAKRIRKGAEPGARVETARYLAEQKLHTDQAHEATLAAQALIESLTDEQINDRWKNVLAEMRESDRERQKNRIRDQPLRDSFTVRMLIYNHEEKMAQSVVAVQNPAATVDSKETSSNGISLQA